MIYYLKVLDLVIQIKAQYSMLQERISKYIIEKQDKYDISINYSDERLQKLAADNPHLDISEVEYILTSIIFYEKILDFDAMLLHSSCVVVDNEAYCFSADSGVGKSTHTKLYLKYHPNTYILNDDKPAYRIIDDKIYVYGTPWSGKDDISENVKVPLKAICFLKQGANNSIRKLNNKEAISLIMRQTLTNYNNEKMLDIIDKIISNYPIYELTCNISKEAYELSYETMRNQK